MIFVLMWVTQMFGLLTELYSRPASTTSKKTITGTDGKEKEVVVTLWKQYMWHGDYDMYDPDDQALLPKEPAYASRMIARRRRANYVYRMLPHVIGIFPYVTVWVVVLNGFFSQLEDLKIAQPDIYERIPEWVTAAIAGTVIVFTLFTFRKLCHPHLSLNCIPNVPFPPPTAQWWYQWLPPHHYWKTELWYCALSATSKLLLGILLYVNVVLVGSVDTALTFHNTTETNIDSLGPTV